MPFENPKTEVQPKQEFTIDFDLLRRLSPTAVHIDNQLRRVKNGLYELLNVPSNPAFIARHQGKESFDADEPAEPNQFLAACKGYLQRACIGRSVENAYYDNF